MITQIYYGDNSVVEWKPGDNPPSRDIQLILQDDLEIGLHFVAGGDYYILRDDRWIAVDIFGLFDYLMDTGLVLFGRTINNKEYQKIYQQAKAKKDEVRLIK